MTSAAWRTGEPSACSANVGRDTCTGKWAPFKTPVARFGAKMSVMTARPGLCSVWVPGATPQIWQLGRRPRHPEIKLSGIRYGCHFAGHTLAPAEMEDAVH